MCVLQNHKDNYFWNTDLMGEKNQTTISPISVWRAFTFLTVVNSRLSVWYYKDLKTCQMETEVLTLQYESSVSREQTHKVPFKKNSGNMKLNSVGTM